MLKYIICLAGMLFIFFTFSACEKVIDVDLDQSNEMIVIEATVSYSKLPFKVLVSKTTPYFGEKKSNPVSGAIVTVRAENGKVKYLSEKSAGVYELDKIIALPGYWYIIDVLYQGVTYSARSFMNEPVQISEIGVSYFDGFGIFESGYKINTYIRDPISVKNYYRLKYYVNGKPAHDEGEITLFSDQLFDGKAIGLSQGSAVFKQTDTLTVELQSIDKATFDYFSTLENITWTDIQQTARSATPANPISNFNNGALGYFSAYTLDRKTVIIKDLIGE